MLTDQLGQCLGNTDEHDLGLRAGVRELLQQFGHARVSRRIADAIILQRQIKPYKDIKDFKQQNYGFSDSIRKVEPYIVTKSSFFAIEVTAVCGNAIVSSVATVKFEKGKPQTVAIISN